MSASFNKAFILGTLIDLPHMRYSQHGDPHALLTLKCSTKDSPNDDTVHTDWVKAVCYQEVAEYAERHLNPGDLIWVEGPVELLEWTDGRSKVHKDTVVMAEKMFLVAAFKPGQRQEAGNESPIEDMFEKTGKKQPKIKTTPKISTNSPSKNQRSNGVKTKKQRKIK